MSPYNSNQIQIEPLKEFVYLFTRYIKKRCEYFETMDKSELTTILRLLDNNFPFFFNSNPQIEQMIEQRLLEYYNSDFNYLNSVNPGEHLISAADGIPHAEQLPKLDSRRVIFLFYAAIDSV